MDRIHYYTAKNLKETDMKFGSMSIATTNTEGITSKRWLHGQWTDNAQNFWDDFTEDGKLTEEEDIESKGCDLLEHYDFSFLNLKERISSISCFETLQPDEEKTFEFLTSWYFPNRPKGWIEYDNDLERYRNGGYDSIKNYYATLFKDAWDVSRYVVENKEYRGSWTTVLRYTGEVKPVASPAKRYTVTTTLPMIGSGDMGRAVEVWQKIVGVKEDGEFGPKTKAATIAFQQKHSLEVDGIAGPESWGAGLRTVG